MKQYFSVKEPELLAHLALINPLLLRIFADMVVYTKEMNYPELRITRMIDERIPGVSTSDTHIDGRAIDASIDGWSHYEVQEFMRHFNGKYSEQYGAYSLKSGLPNLIPDVNHGTAPHFHIQIRRM